MKKLLIPLLFTSYFSFAQLQKVEKRFTDGKIEETGYLDIIIRIHMAKSQLLKSLLLISPVLSHLVRMTNQRKEY